MDGVVRACGRLMLLVSRGAGLSVAEPGSEMVVVEGGLEGGLGWSCRRGDGRVGG